MFVSKCFFYIHLHKYIYIYLKIRQSGLPQEICQEMNYTEEELIITERKLAISLNFDINVPLSYVFLRRYARVSNFIFSKITNDINKRLN